MKIIKNLNTFTDFKLLKLEVPTICLVTGCVLGRRERRYDNLMYATLVAISQGKKWLLKSGVAKYKASNTRSKV